MKSARILVIASISAATAGCGPAPYAVDPEPPAPVYAPPVEVVASPAQVVVVQPSGAYTPAPATGPHGVVLGTLRSYQPKLDKCYRKGLRKNRGLAGYVVVRMEIDEDGKVGRVHDHGSDLPNRKVIKCMLDVYEDVEFSPATAGTAVIYPLYFSPSRRR